MFMNQISDLKEKISDRSAELISENKVKKYAIAIPFIQTEKGLEILFERRSSFLKQSNDICFPGGRVENNESLQAAAIRETSEELLIDKEQVELLGEGDIYIGLGHAIVASFFVLLHNYENTYSLDEVESIHRIPLDELLKCNPDEYEGQLKMELADNFPYDKINGGENYQWVSSSRRFLFYSINDIVIWGLTAQLLKSALKIIEKSGFVSN